MLLTLTLILTLLAFVADWIHFHRQRRRGATPQRGFILWALATDALPLVSAIVGQCCRDNGPVFMTFFMWIFWGWIVTVLPRMLYYLFHFAGLRRTGLVLAGALTLFLLWGTTLGRTRIRVNRVEICSDRIPAAFDGYRIAHISDLHLGTYGRDTAFVHRFVGRVNALRPDAVLFTGDLVNVSAAEAEPYVGLLARLSAPDGVTSVLGNHDYCEYGRYATRDGALRQRDMVVEYEREMGWQLLRDSSVVVRRGADSIALIGVENTGRPPFPARGNLKKAMCGLPEGIFKILLTHDPSHWRSEVLPATDIDLTLSGHTHAVQLRIGGFSPARWVYPEWGGLYVEGGRALQVSVGAGGTVPFRLGAWPEIDIVTLRRGGA